MEAQVETKPISMVERRNGKEHGNYYVGFRVYCLGLWVGKGEKKGQWKLILRIVDFGLREWTRKLKLLLSIDGFKD